jgi:hypothetical protein
LRPIVAGRGRAAIVPATSGAGGILSNNRRPCINRSCQPDRFFAVRRIVV